MESGLIITAGCSWTYGIGAGYKEGMNLADYEFIIQKDKNVVQLFAEKYSFRALLSKKFNFKNINLSLGKSSNQSQFRMLKNFLCSSEAKTLTKKYSNVIVLHGITSTARNELYLSGFDKLVNFKYDEKRYKEYSSIFVKYFYSHQNEIDRLCEEMNFMNDYYKNAGIKNLWFDTFNHHNYPTPIDNLIEFGHEKRDLMSNMLYARQYKNFDNNYHYSIWKNDTDRLDLLLKDNLLNPFSFHPTKSGHALIADLLEPHMQQLI